MNPEYTLDLCLCFFDYNYIYQRDGSLSSKGKNVGARHGPWTSTLDSRFDLVHDIKPSCGLKIRSCIFLALYGWAIVQQQRSITPLLTHMSGLNIRLRD